MVDFNLNKSWRQPSDLFIIFLDKKKKDPPDETGYNQTGAFISDKDILILSKSKG
jgi:hypothetical protein